MINLPLSLITITVSTAFGLSQLVPSLPRGCDPLKFQKPFLKITTMTTIQQHLPILHKQLIIPLHTTSFTINCTFHKPIKWRIDHNSVPVNVVRKENVTHSAPSARMSGTCYSANLVFPNVREEITALFQCIDVSDNPSYREEVFLFSGHISLESQGYLLRRGLIDTQTKFIGEEEILMECQVTDPSVSVQFYYAQQMNSSWTLIPKELTHFHPIYSSRVNITAVEKSLYQFFLKCQTNISNDYYILHYKERIRIYPDTAGEILTLSIRSKHRFECEANSEVNMIVVESIPGVEYSESYGSGFKSIMEIEYLGSKQYSRKVGVLQCNSMNKTLHSWRHKLFDNHQSSLGSSDIYLDSKTRIVTCVSIAIQRAYLVFFTASTSEHSSISHTCSTFNNNFTCTGNDFLTPVESTPNSISVQLPPVSGKIKCHALEIHKSMKYTLNTDETTLNILPTNKDLAYVEHVSHEIRCFTRDPEVGNSLECKCTFSTTLFKSPIIPAITWNNGSLQFVPFTDVPLDISKLQGLSFHYKIFSVVIPSADVRGVSCGGRSSKLYFANWTITPKQQKLHLKGHRQTTLLITRDQASLNISCVAVSYPIPQITWNIRKEILNSPGTEITEQIKVTNTTAVTIESNIHLTYENFQNLTEIECVARVNQTSVGGEVISLKKTFKLQRISNQGPWNQTTTVVVVVISVTSFLLFLSVVILVIRAKYQVPVQINLSIKEIDQFLKGNPNITGDNGYENAQRMPFNGTKYELTRSCLELQHDILGSGAYGVVIKGLFHGVNGTGAVDVAVKMVKPDTDIEYLKALLGELKVMAYIENHPYIAELIGAVTTNLTKSEIFVVLRFYPNGSLKDFLKDNRRHFMHKSKHERKNFKTHSDIAGRNTITNKDLVQWSYEIALGLDFLVSKKVIHGDIAARNILLDENRQAKIGDFGLARQLYNYSLYVKTSKVPLPWRWMSYEAMCDMAFSHQSDVWAFGVTLWEIFTLGQLPYPGVNWDSDFINFLQEGHRLTKPELASQQIYNCVLYPTWNLDPAARPSFLELAQTLKPFL